MFVFQTVNAPLKVNFMQSIDMAQLHQSRLGLISQAVMLIITVCFLLSEILGEFWKKKWVVAHLWWFDSFLCSCCCGCFFRLDSFIGFRLLQGRLGEPEHIRRGFSRGRTRSCSVVPLRFVELHQVIWKANVCYVVTKLIYSVDKARAIVDFEPDENTETLGHNPGPGDNWKDFAQCWGCSS